MNDFGKNWCYSMEYEQELNRITFEEIFSKMFRKSTKKEDMKECTDSVYEGHGVRIAHRVRRVSNTGSKRDFTIRWSCTSGVKTEIDKLPESDLKLYAYAWESEGRIIEYILIDVPKFVSSGLIEKPCQIRRAYSDGNEFACYSIHRIQDAGCLIGGMSEVGSPVQFRWCSSQEYFNFKENKSACQNSKPL